MTKENRIPNGGALKTATPYRLIGEGGVGRRCPQRAANIVPLLYQLTRYSLLIQISDFFRHSCFVIRHSRLRASSFLSPAHE